MRGRKPKPNETKRAEGNPGHRKPVPGVWAPEGDFDPPFKLVPVARAEWDRIRTEAPWLRASDAVAVCDRCQCFARLVSAEADITERGYVVKTRNGMVANPSVRIARNYRAALQKYDAELGLTSTSRQRVHTHEDPDAGRDELARILAMPRTPRVPRDGDGGKVN